jgi:hypothetical protein
VLTGLIELKDQIRLSFVGAMQTRGLDRTSHDQLWEAFQRDHPRQREDSQINPVRIEDLLN